MKRQESILGRSGPLKDPQFERWEAERSRRLDRLVWKSIGVVVALCLFACWWFLGFKAERLYQNGKYSDDAPGLLNRIEIAEAVFVKKPAWVRRIVWYGYGFYAFTSSNQVLTMDYGQDGTAHVLHVASYKGNPRDFAFTRIESDCP